MRKKILALDADGVVVDYDQSLLAWLHAKGKAKGITLEAWRNRRFFHMHKAFPLEWPTLGEELADVHEFGILGGMADLQQWAPDMQLLINEPNVFVISKFPEWQRQDRITGLWRALGLADGSRVLGAWDTPKHVILDNLASRHGVLLEDTMMVEDNAHHLPPFGNPVLVHHEYNRGYPSQRVRADKLYDHCANFLYSA
jgi:hypothetical protein